MTIKRKVSKKSGFTLIEMIGVLAIIAILTALLIPKIFQVINDSRINNAVASYNSAKAATAAMYGKYGGFTQADGTVSATFPVEDWDIELVNGGYLEARFTVKVGNGDHGTADTGMGLRLVDISANNAGVAVTTGATGLYSLAGGQTTTTTLGDGTNPVTTTVTSDNDVTGSFLVEAVIRGVAIQDAIAIDQRIDGPTLSALADDRSNLVGRVKWDGESGPTATVRIYVAHR